MSDHTQVREYIVPIEDGRLTAHEFVRETLRRAILRGDLVGGARLIQADVAARLKVSTTPVREALRDLATEGLITLDRHRGGTVRDLNWDDMQEIIAIHERIEPLGVQLALERISEEELDRAEAIAGRMVKVTDTATWVELNQKFHYVFHDATRSPRLSIMLRGLQDAAGMYTAQAQRLRPDLRRRANEEHQALLGAFRRRDLDAALEIQAGHIGMALETRESGRGSERNKVAG
jgi:DNA-binding GntR family transcriptional regulator